MSVHPLHMLGKITVEGEPEEQPDNYMIEIFDSDEKHSDVDNEDFDAELNRQLQKRFDKQFKYNTGNELVAYIFRA